ncbi:MAG: restriction endonuclease [Chloroflexota bacterium]
MSTRWTVQVPTYEQLTLPLLQLAADGAEHTLRDAAEAIAAQMGLSARQQDELLPSGRRTRFYDRLAWAKNYLVHAGLLARTGWGRFRITRRGLAVLELEPVVINRRYLMQFPEFRAWQVRAVPPVDLDAVNTGMTPHELMQVAHLGLQQDLADELLDIVLGASPAFFERLVIDLLLAMGYGGSRRNAARALGQRGDGGIDGVIHEDKLGLDTIYVQAKRWARDRAVGRPDVQGFVGSLIGAGGKKGVFITTSRFTREALGYAEGVTETKVILIDGARLAGLMMEHGVGVVAEQTYVVQTVDRDYFDID